MTLQVDAQLRIEHGGWDPAGPAAPPRTLVDVFAATSARFPDAPALDDGSVCLTYAGLADEVRIQADRLAAAGVRPGDRVGVRVPSGTAELYVAILAALHAGAAYVPVEADDPAQRSARSLRDAGVHVVIGAGLALTHVDGSAVAIVAGAARAEPPAPADDAWVIFTSGSTGRPKAVAVSHRSAAAWADAEAGLFLAAAPLGPGDRVLAGLSVAFDASCEEMWLAWRHGAALVPAPRALVARGAELAGWLAEHRITVVSTVPTLAALWPAQAMAGLRLLIFGGEPLGEDLVARLWRPGLELWNTYGPTEATVVTSAARLEPGAPVRIGRPLPGWELEVVDPEGAPVGPGEVGELVIGGVGLARYLDPALDAARFAPMAGLGWDRAYRTGDLVRADPAGMVFVGRADDQVKVNGRRIELAEVDAALLQLPGVVAAAAAVRRAASGSVLVGYVVPGDPEFDTAAAVGELRRILPASLVPLLAVVAHLPTRTSGKVDRDGLPWPIGPSVGDAGASVGDAGASVGDAGTSVGGATVAQAWEAVLGVRPEGPDDDFFARGGSSLSAALLAAQLRTSHPRLTIAEIYDHPTLAGLAAHLAVAHRDPHTPAAGLAGSGEPGSAGRATSRPDGDRASGRGSDDPAAARGDGADWVRSGPAGAAGSPGADPGSAGARPVPLASRAVQVLALLPLRGAVAMRWLTALAGLNLLLHVGGVVAWASPVPWWWVLVGWLLTVSPLGRMGLSALVARLLLAGVGPGTYPRGGQVHLRVWAAQRFADGFGAMTVATSPWVHLYARALGARVGRDVDLHTVPPVTGLLTLGTGCAVEREVDLSGCRLDGDVVHIGTITIGARARVGARTVLYPGAMVGRGAEVAAGSAVLGSVPPGARWAGAPAVPVGSVAPARPAMPADPAADGLADWPEDRPRSRRHPGWLLAFAAAGAMVGMLPLLAVVPGLLLVGRAAAGAASPAGAVVPVLGATALGVLAALLLYAALVVAAIRLLALRLRPGCHPVRSWPGVRAWTIERLSDCATAALFPLYASVLTPAWLRALGARVGRGAEISTVTGLPSMMRVKGGSFLADDTLVAPYELRGGWMRIARATVGARAFLGNSGMTAPGHKVPKRGLVAVLSAAPRTSRKGSSWLGSPPAPIPRAQLEVDGTRTYRPGVGMILARGTVELLRVLPVLVAGLLAAGALLTLQAVVLAEGWALAAAAGGPVLVAAGAVAGAVTACAKWLLVGRYRVGEHPLWSAAVWRGELADTFTEVLAAPFLAGPAAGSPALVWWLRAMGARIGRGVWCETYWLPEPDLVRVGDAAGIGPGCVLQTHLFHDRLMSLDRVTLGHGATVGANSVVLPGAILGPGCAVGPGSLVLRGEQLPPGRWSGNPVAAWPVEPTTVSARPVEPTTVAAPPVDPAPTQP